MAQFWAVVNKVIEQSDIVIEVLDARFPDLTRNEEIEDKVKKKGKKLLFVLNKVDLVSKKRAEKYKKKLGNVVFVSAVKKLGTTILLKKILELGKGEEVIVGVVGYPNTGKSSIINALKGRKSASASAVSGHTKGIQKLKVHPKIILLDSPGVIPYLEKDRAKHAVIGAISSEKLKDAESVAEELIEALDGHVESHYGIEGDDPLEELAVKWNMLKKGGVPDTVRAAKKLLEEWQKGKILI